MNRADFDNRTLLLLAQQIKQLQATLAIIESKKITLINKQQRLWSLHDSIEQHINAMISTPPVRQHHDTTISTHGALLTENASSKFTTLIKHNWKVKLARSQIDARITRIHRQNKRIRKVIDKAQALKGMLVRERKSGPLSSSLQRTLELLVLRNQLLLKQYWADWPQ